MTTMDSILSKRIDSLPTELQELIFMFNVEHRTKMKKVFKYIHHILYHCFTCEKYIIPHIHRDSMRIAKRILVCSKECEVIAEEWLVGVPL